MSSGCPGDQYLLDGYINPMENKIKPYPLCLGNISKNFTVNNTEKTGLNIYANDFSINYNTIEY